VVEPHRLHTTLWRGSFALHAGSLRLQHTLIICSRLLLICDGTRAETISSYSLGSIFINVYMVLFLFDNIIYVFLLLWLNILIVCLCMSTLTEVFPCFSSTVRQMPGYNSQKRGMAQTLPNFCVVICIVCFVSFSLLFVCVYVYWTTATGWLPNCS